MKNINTLVQDIYRTIQDKGGWFGPELSEMFSQNLSQRLGARLSEERDRPRLRLSGMGPRCPKQLWHSIHTPELAEPLPPWAEIKYAYGEIIESMILMLAKAAGHTVEGMQDELVVAGVSGHRDAVIDGCLVDVKSASSYGFEKFKTGTLAEDDPFGYLDQLDGYLMGSDNDPLVTVKDRAYILGVDKTLGHVCLYEHKRRGDTILNRIKKYQDIVALSSPPPCECGTVADGKSGNVKLDVRASYSPFKRVCFPNLREFRYATGPVYLTKVVRTPNVKEVDRYGNVINDPSAEVGNGSPTYKGSTAS